MHKNTPVIHTAPTHISGKLLKQWATDINELVVKARTLKADLNKAGLGGNGLDAAEPFLLSDFYKLQQHANEAGVPVALLVKENV
jgi:hypothetical protein